ncbi:MAG: glycosyltransferase family 4 protein [Candidatus Krumholzibacteria bacterium]
MKICIVSLGIVPYYRHDQETLYGGAETQAAFVADALASSGLQVTLVVSSLTPEASLPHAAENAFSASDGVPGLRFWHPRLTGILKALQRAAADVYYQRNAGMVTGLTAMFCRRKGKVFVYGGGSDTDFSFRDVLIPGLRDKALYHLGLKLAHGIVVQNRSQEERCLRRVKKPVRIIPNGVNLPDGDDSQRKDLILWVGAIRRVKQPELFLELARRLPDMRFVLVGGPSGNEKNFAQEIMRAAESLPNLELPGHTSHDKLLQYLQRTVVLVNTSRFEGFPNAFLEAWSYGVPVVSTNDVDGLIEREQLGGICRDVEGMRALVSSLAADPQRSRETGDRARSVIAERFSASIIAGKYRNFFEELLNEHHARKTPHEPEQ